LSFSAAATAQALQIHAVPCACKGTLASRVGVKVVLMHQHGGWVWPVCFAVTIAQLLLMPHNGQNCGG